MAEWSSRYSYADNNVELYVPTSGGVYRKCHRDVRPCEN